jgi:hypothetical protein
MRFIVFASIVVSHVGRCQHNDGDPAMVPVQASEIYDFIWGTKTGGCAFPDVSGASYALKKAAPLGRGFSVVTMRLWA